MVFDFNQTSSRFGNDQSGNSHEGLDWYPYPPGQCPPKFNIIVQGFCAPLIIIISTVLNSLIAVVLLQKHLRSPTNILLLAIALYDTLTGLFPFPSYIFVFTFRQCNDYMPYNYGWFHRICHDVLPFIFHTCSIWITVVLAIQRYIYVCYSEKAKQWCTVPVAIKAIACVNVLALIVAIPMFVEGTFHKEVVYSLMDPERTFDACKVKDYSEHPDYRTLFTIYSIVRALLINVGPCTVLVILNTVLVQRMKEAKINRDKLIRRRSYETKTQEQSNVTLMLVIVVTMFLIVEIPMALYLIITAILRALKINIFAKFFAITVQLLNFAVLLSYPINFFIYCRMSRAFRDAFTKLVCPSFIRIERQTLQTMGSPLASKPGTTVANTDQLELHNKKLAMNEAHTGGVQSMSSVISNSTLKKKPIPSNDSLSQRISNDSKKISTGSTQKPSVSFSDNTKQLNNDTKNMDL